MRRFRQKLPHPIQHPTRYRRRHIPRRIPQINRVNLRPRISRQKTRTERKNPPPIRRRALGKNTNDTPRKPLPQLLQPHELRPLGGSRLRLRHRKPYSREQRDDLDLPLVGPRADENGAEDAGQVQRVERGGEAAGHDVAGLREGAFGLRGGEVPALDAVDLEVNPPDAWHREEQPEDAFLYCGAHREELEEEEIEEGHRDDGEEAQAEEERVDGGPER